MSARSWHRNTPPLPQVAAPWRIVGFVAAVALLACLPAARGQAPNYLWARGVGGSGNDWPGAGYDSPGSVAVNTAGDVYVTGSFESPNITLGSFTLTNTGPYRSEEHTSELQSPYVIS